MKKAITIAGDLGSGKTTIGRLLAELLGYHFISIGKFFRDIAEKEEISLNVLQEQMKTDSAYDIQIDEMQKEFMEKNDKYVIDSRLGRLFDPSAFSVYLRIDPLVGAQRIWDELCKNPDRLSESGAKSVEEVYSNNVQRVESERFRYANLYNFDHTKLALYDDVRWGDMRPEENANILYIKYHQRLK